MQAHFDLKIPKEHHRFVIGRQGERLKKIELETATKVCVCVRACVHACMRVCV